ncbi:MAG: V-type ATPase subunit [Deltaproteobacteria bacterium]|nr:V-type ATPase subunit [Deltaproteobacteria bacterium]
MKYYADDVNLHVRIHAMRSRLIPLDEYASLLREQEASYDKSLGPRGMIEAKETAFRVQIKGIIHLAEATQKYAPLFIAFLRLYEANNVKIILAKAFGRQSLEQWYNIGPYATLDKGLLDRELSLGDVQAILGGTYLADIFEGRMTFERLEARLNICSVRNLYASSAPFRPEARRDFRDFILRRLAVLMVIWQWRLRVNYHWSDERIEAHRDELSAIFGDSAWPQLKMVEGVLSSRLEEMGKGSGQTPDPADVKSYLERYYYRWTSSMFHKDFHSIYCVVAYLWLLSCQIRNLFCVIEGVRFGLSHEAIFEKIISDV